MGHQSQHVYKVSYTYVSTRVFEILREKHGKHILIRCCCLQTCNSAVNILVMGLVLGPSLMVISITGILLYAKVSPLYNVLWECIVVVVVVEHMSAHKAIKV